MPPSITSLLENGLGRSYESKKSAVTRGESLKSSKAERTYRATRFARDASRRVARAELIARRREYSTR